MVALAWLSLSEYRRHPNFSGDTTAFYFGIFNYEFSLSNKFLDGLTNNFTKNLWFAAGLSTAIHTGPLRKNEGSELQKTIVDLVLEFCRGSRWN